MLHAVLVKFSGHGNSIYNSHQRFDARTRRLGNKRMSQDHPNYRGGICGSELSIIMFSITTV